MRGRKGKVFNILIITIGIIFFFQSIGLSKVTDLREEGKLGTFDVVVAVISGVMQGLSVGKASVYKAFAQTYVVPVVANKVCEGLDIKSPIAKAAIRAGLSVGAGTALEHFSSELKRMSKDAVQQGAKETAKETAKATTTTAAKTAAQETVRTTASSWANAIKNTAGKIGETIGKSSIVQYFSAAVKSIWNGIKRVVSWITEPIKKLVSREATSNVGSAVVEKTAENAAEESTEELAKNTVEEEASKQISKKAAQKVLKDKTTLFKDSLKAGAYKAVQAAAQAAVKQLVIQELQDDMAEWWCFLLADTAGLAVGETTGLALSKVTGMVFDVDENGIKTEKKEGEELNKYLKEEVKEFSKIAFERYLPAQFIVALGAQLGVREAGIVGSAIFSSLTRRSKETFPELEAQEKILESKSKEEVKFTKEGITTISQVETKKITKESPAERKLSAERKLVSFRKRQKEEGFWDRVLEGAIEGGISVGLQKLSLKTPSPLHGAYMNLFLTSLGKSLFYWFKGDVEPAQGEGILNKAGHFFSYLASQLRASGASALADFYSMGRATAQDDGESKLWSLKWHNPNDVFFINRYIDYMRTLDEEGFMYAMMDQWISSVHRQSINEATEIYQLLRGQIEKYYFQLYKKPSMKKIRKRIQKLEELRQKLENVKDEKERQKLQDELKKAIRWAKWFGRIQPLKDFVATLEKKGSKEKDSQLLQEIANTAKEYLSLVEQGRKAGISSWRVARGEFSPGELLQTKGGKKTLMRALNYLKNKILEEAIEEGGNNWEEGVEIAKTLGLNKVLQLIEDVQQGDGKLAKEKIKEVKIYEDLFENVHYDIAFNKEIPKSPSPPLSSPPAPKVEVKVKKTIPIEGHFYFDKSKLTPQSKEALKQAINSLLEKGEKIKKVEISFANIDKVGWENPEGKEGKPSLDRRYRNVALRILRTQEVKDYVKHVLEKAGVNLEEAAIKIDYTKASPKAEHGDYKGRVLDRNVEIKLHIEKTEHRNLNSLSQDRQKVVKKDGKYLLEKSIVQSSIKPESNYYKVEVYTIQPGDTLEKIAKHFNETYKNKEGYEKNLTTSAERIMFTNNIKNPRKLKPGTQIVIIME